MQGSFLSLVLLFTITEFNENDSKKISVDGRHGKKIAVECFEPYSINHSVALRPMKFSFGEVKPENAKDRASTISTYSMKEFPHGIALIINNEIFTSKAMRKGTNIDERNLTHIFRYLGYQVEVHRDKKSQEMMEIMFEMGKRSHEMYDSFVCCILSHGTGGHVYGTDGEEVSLHALAEKVDATCCRTLHGKPKLFFLQACRGELKEVAVNVTTDSGESMPPHDPQPSTTFGAHPVATDSDNEIPASADFFFGHATPLGYVAWRDEDHGSWYISELCRSLCEMYRYASLIDIMAKVCDRVASGERYKIIGYRASPESITHLRKNVFF